MKKKALTVASILTGFLAMGFLAGTAWSGYQVKTAGEAGLDGVRPPQKRPQSLAGMHIHKAVEGVELSEAQKNEIKSIAKALETRMAGLRAPFFSEVAKTLKDAHTQIMAQLDDDQKALAQKNIDDWNRRIRQGGFSRRSSGKKGGSSSPGGPREFRDWEKKADVDKDDNLTEAEKNTYWDAYWKARGGGPMPSSYDWGWIVRNFEKVDTDKNGLISTEECAKARETSRRNSGRMGGQGGGRSGGPGGGRNGSSHGDGPPKSRGDRGSFDNGKPGDGLKDAGKPVKQDQ